jgi:hypothetical protein
VYASTTQTYKNYQLNRNACQLLKKNVCKGWCHKKSGIGNTSRWLFVELYGKWLPMHVFLPAQTPLNTP